MTTTTSNTEEIEATILRMAGDIMMAIKDKDAAALGPMLADEFIYRTHFGAEADKATFLESITTFPMKIPSLHSEELQVNVYGETAVVTGVQVAEARPP